MRFEVTRVSIMDIEGIEDEREAGEILAALSKDTEGRSMLFQQRPVRYVLHVSTHAKLIDRRWCERCGRVEADHGFPSDDQCSAPRWTTATPETP